MDPSVEVTLEEAPVRNQTLLAGRTRNQGTMADGTRLRVLPPERSRIETRTVGIEPPTPGRRVAGEAVPLGMTSHTALQVLAGGLSVVQDEGLLRIMKTAAPKPTGGNQSRADMAVGAELGLAVTLAAGAFPTVRGGGMGREEAGRMVSRRCVGRAGTMALETGGTGVAGGAGLRPRGSESGVGLGEVQAMRFRSPALDLGSLAAAGCGSPNGLDAGGGAYMASQAAFLGVAGRTSGRALTDLPSVLTEKRRVGMARRGLELRMDCQRAWIRSERLDRGHLRGVHVALGTEILGVTGGAGGGDRACRTRQLSVQRPGESGLPVRRRRRKVPYRRAAESDRLDQWQMAGGAGGVGRIEVRRPNSVAGETVGDHGEPHLHRIGARGNMTGATWEHGIDPRSLGNQLGMFRVGKPEIGSSRLIRCGPLHGTLDGTVVALLANAWGRPEGQAGIGCAGVAPHAGGEDGSVLPVIEAILNHSATRAPRSCDCPGHEDTDQQTDQFHRTPARGSGGRAGGSGALSVWLRRMRVTRAVRRVWFQSNAAASGRSRVSA